MHIRKHTTRISLRKNLQILYGIFTKILQSSIRFSFSREWTLRFGDCSRKMDKQNILPKYGN